MDRAWLNLGPTLLFLGLMSAEGHLKLALAVPGSPWAGPYDPMGALYGRRGHGRLRRPRIHIPGTDGRPASEPSMPAAAVGCAHGVVGTRPRAPRDRQSEL